IGRAGRLHHRPIEKDLRRRWLDNHRQLGQLGFGLEVDGDARRVATALHFDPLSKGFKPIGLDRQQSLSSAHSLQQGALAARAHLLTPRDDADLFASGLWRKLNQQRSRSSLLEDRQAEYPSRQGGYRYDQGEREQPKSTRSA